MPIYEYYCGDCEQQVDIFFRRFSDVEKTEKICPNCGSQNLTKQIGRVAVLSGARESQTVASKKNDSPTELARLMREASNKSGQDFGSEFQEVAHRLEKGENPKHIEKTLRKRAGQPLEDVH